MRAKRKIRDAGIPLEVPPAERLPERLDAVLTVLSLVFTEGYVATGGPGLRRDDLAEEAIRLARRPRRADARRGRARGAARADDAPPRPPRRARRRRTGALVLLDDQDRALWDREAIARGIAGVERALRMRRPPGRFALQAAIAAVHAEAPGGRRDRLAPDPRALRRADAPRRPRRSSRSTGPSRSPRSRGREAGLELVDALAGDGALGAYAPLHAARADLLRRLGRAGEAADEYALAARLTANPAERAFLAGRARRRGSPALGLEARVAALAHQPHGLAGRLGAVDHQLQLALAVGRARAAGAGPRC